MGTYLSGNAAHLTTFIILRIIISYHYTANVRVTIYLPLKVSVSEVSEASPFRVTSFLQDESKRAHLRRGGYRLPRPPVARCLATATRLPPARPSDVIALRKICYFLYGAFFLGIEPQLSRKCGLTLVFQVTRKKSTNSRYVLLIQILQLSSCL